MDNKVFYGELYDIYGELLTDKQKMYFEDYYFEDLSLGEMADNYKVTRNAIFKQIHIVIDRLLNYESKLKLYEKKLKIEDIIKKSNDLELNKCLESIIYSDN